MAFGASGLALVAALLAVPSSGAMGLSGLALLAALLLTALQLLPLPAALHGVSPAARSLFEEALGPLGLYPAARPLSLDPAETGLALANAAGGLAAFMMAWRLGTAHRRRGLLVVALGASGLAVALLVLGRALVGYGPLLVPNAPFVNPNHLAGFLGLTSFVLLGLALSARGQARLLWLMAFTLTGAGVFLSLSRGGIATFLGGAVLFGALAAWQRQPEAAAEPGPDGAPPRLRPAARGRWALLAGLSAALAVAAYLALDPVLAELRTVDLAGDETKLALWRPALQLVRDYPLTGIGRGAFGTVFPAFKTEPVAVTFTHLENEWLQALVELGLPGGLLLVGALGLTWLAAARRRDRSYADVGLLAGTATLAAQNLVDFSLELPGVALPFLVALGLAARGGGAVKVAPWLLRGGLVLVGLLGGLGASTWLRQPNPGASAVEQVAWRPADYLPQAVEGARLAEEGECQTAMPWLTRAMLLGPTAAEPHLYAARCLAASGQAALARREYRLALLFGAPTALQEAAGLYPEVEALREVVPDSADGLLRLGAFLGRERPADAAVAYRVALEEFLDTRALVPLAQIALAGGGAEEALPLAQRRVLETPTDPEGWRLVASALVQLGREEEALAELERGLAQLPGSPPLITAKAERSMAARRFSEAKLIAEQMRASTPRELAARHLLVARALGGQGRWAEALEQAKSAAAARPEDASLHLTLATYCERAGRYDDAIAAVERAASLGGPSATLTARLEALKKARDAQRDRRMGEALLK